MSPRNKMEQTEFVDLIFATAKKVGKKVGINRDGERQVDFDHKSLTAHHLRLLYQDILRKGDAYSRRDMEYLVSGRPCAVAPFFELAIQAGLCEVEIKGGHKVYKFKLAPAARESSAVGAE